MTEYQIKKIVEKFNIPAQNLSRVSNRFNVKKLYFKYLYLKHCLLQLLSIKDKDDNIIKIWQCKETQDTCLYLKGRSGLWYMPISSECTKDKTTYSKWVASVTHMVKYGVLYDKKNKATIYKLFKIESEPV